jgi:hypothetical protein
LSIRVSSYLQHVMVLLFFYTSEHKLCTEHGIGLWGSDVAEMRRLRMMSFAEVVCPVTMSLIDKS